MSSARPNEASRYLIRLARQNVRAYSTLPTIRAIVLTGSASEGVSDAYSDLDVILYYDQLPSEQQLEAAYAQNHGVDRGPMLPRSDDQFMEHYQVEGVECQFAHTTVAAWEQEMASVLEQLDVTSPTQKALGGMEEAIPLYGETLVQQWQTRLAAYPESLALAMVRHHLAFFPLWGLQERMKTRDATIWLTEMLVDNGYALIGTLAGLNRLYFSSFQFKRTQRFIEKLAIAPHDFGERLEALFHVEPASAADPLEALVRETVELVEQRMPQVDTSRVRQRLDWRPQPWRSGERDGHRVK